MAVHDVDVAVRYTLSTVDRGVRQAVSLSQNLTRETRSAQKELDAALRANSAAWKDTARVASSAQRQVTEAASRASSQVDKSLVREVASLRTAGVGYKEISAAARGWGASAEQAAAAIKRSADVEIKEIDRVVAARNKLRSMVGLSAKTTSTRSGAGAEERGLERGATRAAAGKLRSGVSYLGAGLVGGLVGYAGVEGVKQAVDSTKDLALQTRTLSAVTGMDSKTASEWVAITQARDIKTRTFAMTLKTLSTQTEGATSGSKKSVQAFKDLGITTDDLKKHSGDLSSLLGLVADHLDKMPGGAEKTAVASQLLGRNWSALQPVLLEGSKGMADQRKEAAALGVTLGGNAAENAKKLEEASVSLKIAQEGLEVQFAEHVAPALIKVTEGGIKLFGVLRQDLGPAFHFVTGEVKDVSHWLGEHKTVLKAVEVALGGVAAGYLGLKVISGTVRLVRGVASDFMTAKNAISGVAHPIQALKGLFGEQESESQALMRSQTALAEANERLAKSFDQVAASSKGAAGGEALAGEESGLAGGAPILGRGKGALGEEKALAGEEASLAGGGGKGITAAEKLGTAAETEIAQTGMWGMLLGRQGEQTLTSRLASLGSGLMKGAGVGFAGMLGSQLIGGAIGGKAGKTVTSLGTAASIGAGAGMVLGVPGALAGAGIGAGTAELQHLFGGGDNADAVKKLQAQMVDAAKRDDWKKLQQLADNATSASRGLQALGKNTTSQDLKKLGNAAQKTASSLQLQSAGRAVTGIESSIAGSKFAPSVSQITKATTSQLASLGPQAQKAGAAAIVKFTAGLESQKRLPVGSTDKLIRQLEAEYGPSFASTLQKSGTQSMKAFENTVARSKVVSKVQDQVDQMHKQWGLLVPDVKVTSSNIEQIMTSNIEAMRKKVLNSTGQEQQDAIGHLNALLGLYSKYSPLISAAGASAFTSMARTVSSTLGALGKTIGGSLGGWVSLISQFASAVTPALSTIAGSIAGGSLSTPSGAKQVSNTIGGLLSGLGIGKQEGGYFHGVVPGDHTRDGTLAWLSGREFVMTGDGQQMMDSYAPGLLDHIAASQAPHFAKGGPVGGNVWNVRASAEESSSGIGWTELSTNGNAAAVSGHPHTATHHGGWDFATLGRKYPKGTKLQISSGGRSGVFPLTAFGDGSSFAPAIGLTPAVQSALGGMPSTVDISLADGANIALASGFGKLVSGSGGTSKKKGVKESLQPNTKTTFSPSGPGLGDGYYQGYEYGLDPTTGVGGAAALHAAILGSQLTAHTTSAPAAEHFTLPKIPTLSGIGSLPKNLQGKGKLVALDRNMTAVARHFLGKPYAAAGGAANGRPPNLGASALDCSAAVSAVVNLGGAGVLPPVPSPWTTDPLKSWGLPGDGRYITVGVRGTSGSDAHTMMQFFGHFYESSHPGKGPHWDGGWSEDFPIRRHPPGLRRGGRIPGFAKGGSVSSTKPKLFGATPPLTAGQIKDQNSARALMGRIWTAAHPFYPGSSGKMPRTLLAGEWEPFVGDAWSPGDTKIKDRQILWPQWMTSMLLGKPDQGNAGGRGAVNNALETLVHEWTHQYQAPHLLSTGQTWQIEGGADSFAREFAPRIIAGAGIKGYSSPGMGLYDGYVNRVRKQYGEQWIRRGQFTDNTRKYRAGGGLPRFRAGGGVRYNDAGWWYKQQGLKPPQAAGSAGTFMAPQHGTVDDRWRHRRRYARGGYVGAGAAGTFLPPQPVLPPSLTYQPVMSITQPVAPPAGSFYGTHTAAGETRVLRRETTSISSAGTNQEAARALSQLNKTVDNVKKVAYTSLLSEAKELQKAAATATKSGDKQQATRLKQAYQLVTNEAGRRVGALVKAATDEGAALTTANQRLQNMLTRNQIDPASKQGTAFIAKFQDQSVKVIRNEVSKLQKAYELAKKAGNQRAAGDAGSKLQQALSDLDDATAAAVQDHVDQVNAAKQAVADAAQSKVDTATHDVTMASTGEANLGIQEQLAGTSGTMAGAQQLQAYINQSVVPAMQKQVAALQEQQGVAQSQGNTTLAQQIAEQIQSTQGSILQEQLTAQQAIQQATQATAENTQQLVGNLGVSYDNGTYSNLAGMLNGT